MNSEYQTPQHPHGMSGGIKWTLGLIALMGFAAVFYIVVAIAFPEVWHKVMGGETPVAQEEHNKASPGNPDTGKDPAHPDKPRQKVHVGIAYGTEKKRWLTWAVEEFAREKPGIEIKLLPMGSIEGAQAVLREDKTINVWSPASPLYLDRFVQDWKLKFGSDPILYKVELALSPMVFVMWKERYEAFIAKYGKLDYKAISQAISEPSGWDGIAGKPDWGLFKFGHTHPNQSNSGLMSLMLMAYDYSGKTRDLSNKDVLNAGFQKWLADLEKGVNWEQHSTGTLMEQMVLRGPSTFDCVSVYENVAIDYIENAAGRWGEITIVYPERNMWNDNPYIIIDAAWSTPEQRKAARMFADFLMEDRIQRRALEHGFRPGNPAVPVKGPDSPLTKYESRGIKFEIGTVCQPPSGPTLATLLESWQRTTGGR